MRKQNNTRINAGNLLRGQRLNKISTAGLILLMLIYLAMTINSSFRLADQTDIISNHPFEVVIAAGDLKLYISEMSIRTDRLISHRSPEDIDVVGDALAELYNSLEDPLSRLNDLYLGDKEDIIQLRNTLALLQQEQTAFLTFVTASGSSGTDEIEAYNQEHLQPLYTEILEETESIINVAKGKKVGYGLTAEALRRSTLIGSIVLMTLMVGVLLLSQYLLWKQRKELLYRSRLFDNLSLSIDDAFVIMDVQTGAVNYCGLNMDRVLGFTMQSQKDLYRGIKPADASEIQAVINDFTFNFPYEKVLEYSKPDGEIVWMSIRIYRTNGKSVPQFIITFSDRTEEILSRQALQTAMNNAEQANIAKSAFLSRMSHEIRTPLNAILGMTAIAQASITDPIKLRDCFAKIELSSRHLLMLINDVLDMSKIESNKVILKNEPFDILQFLNGYASTVYSQAKARNITFEDSIKGFSADTTYIGDSLRLNQILLNLSSNAVKFTEPGGKIRLEAEIAASKNKLDIIRFRLSDTGIGMDEESIHRIFQPFEQANSSISGRYGGTGLGMSIARNLVLLMNGTIEADSRPGEGTAFTVDIPFRRSTEDVKEPDFEGHNLYALLVDDEEPICVQTASLLNKLKIRTRWTVSCDEALRLIREAGENGQPYHFCFIDWKMPGMDGVELTRHIRLETALPLPIALISAYDTTEIEQQARQAGVNGFLTKPIYRSSAYEVIRELLYIGPKTAVQEETDTSAALPLAGFSLLMAEDNEMNMEIAKTLLEMNGAQVSCAADGRETLEKFLASPPGEFDGILMDIQMPVMDGYEAARRIRASRHPKAAEIPIIAVTANAFSDDITAAYAAGMNAHVSKPLDMQALCQVLNEYIGRETVT